MKHKTWVQNETKQRNQKCAQFKVNSHKHLTNHILYISHIRVNTQQAVVILLDMKAYVMVTFWYYCHVCNGNKAYVMVTFWYYCQMVTFWYYCHAFRQGRSYGDARGGHCPPKILPGPPVVPPKFSAWRHATALKLFKAIRLQNL